MRSPEDVSIHEPDFASSYLEPVIALRDELRSAVNDESEPREDFQAEAQRVFAAARDELGQTIHSGRLSTEDIVKKFEDLSRLQDEISALMVDVSQIDRTTRMPTKSLFYRKLEQMKRKQNEMLASSEGRIEFISIAIYIDIDNLKPVNDVLGHTAGDDLIRAVGEKIRSELRSSDLVTAVGNSGASAESGRAGGDEFIVVIDKVIDPQEDADKVAEDLFEYITGKFIKNMSEFEFEFEEAPYSGEATVGYAYTMDFGRTSTEQFIVEAEQDMQDIKEKKKKQQGWRR